MIYAHVSEPPPLLSSRVAGVPAGGWVLGRALAKEPGERFGSCREFADALRDALGLARYGPGSGIRPGPAWPPAPGPATTHPSLYDQTQDRWLPLAQPGPTAGSRPAGRHATGSGAALSQPGQSGTGPRRPGTVTRRALLGLGAASAAGLAVAGWDLRQHRATSTPRRHPPKAGTQIWQASLPDGIYWDPAIAGTTIYAGGGSIMYAVSTVSGDVLWHDPGVATGVVTGNTVCAVTGMAGSNGLAVLDPRDGAALWRRPPTVAGQLSGPVVTGGVLYYADPDGQVYALRASDGQQLWTLPAGESPQGFAVAGPLVCVVGNQVHALRSGREIWTAPAHGGAVTDPVIAGGLIYVTTADHGIYALRSDNGQAVWNFRNGQLDGIWVAGGLAYAYGATGGIYALQAADGKEIWRSSVSGQGPMVTVAGDIVYASGNDGVMYALRARDGRKIWHLATGGSTTIAAATRETAYIGSNDLYAIRVADGRQLWSFPSAVAGMLLTPSTLYAGGGTELYALRT